jgi:hypothetical protein
VQQKERVGAVRPEGEGKEVVVLLAEVWLPELAGLPPVSDALPWGQHLAF